ncbi:hypothetical protein HAX54_027858 [Datura stramonium]|uniref:Secreted protein n=1 Tax=Datura stramonium TaxID=4076 RepID=A0ABS8S8Z6_DATST|nr:hypothetical protein [Datura stramonium]
MEVLRLCLMAIFGLVMALAVPSINAQVPEPAPAPTSDGVAIDQEHQVHLLQQLELDELGEQVAFSAAAAGNSATAAEVVVC